MRTTAKDRNCQHAMDDLAFVHTVNVNCKNRNTYMIDLEVLSPRCLGVKGKYRPISFFLLAQ